MNTAILGSTLTALALFQGSPSVDSGQRIVLRIGVGQATAQVTIPDGGTAKFTRSAGEPRGVTAALDQEGVVLRLVAISTDPVGGLSSTLVLAEQHAAASEVVTFYDGETPVTVQFGGARLQPTAPAAGGCEGPQRGCQDKCSCDIGGGGAPCQRLEGRDGRDFTHSTSRRPWSRWAFTGSPSRSENRSTSCRSSLLARESPVARYTQRVSWSDSAAVRVVTASEPSPGMATVVSAPPRVPSVAEFPLLSVNRSTVV